MALNDLSSREFQIKSLADGYVNYFISETPNQFERVPFLPMEVRIRLESSDLEKRTLTMTMHGNWVSEIYKTFKATFIVTPKEHNNGSRVAWTVEFDKIRHDFIDTEIFDYLIGYFLMIDEKFHVRCVLNGKVDFINVKSPANKCFKDFIEAFKKDANMKIETVDLETRTSTMRLSKYKTLKVTTTITPMEHTLATSHVAWTIKSDNDIIDPDSSIGAVLYLREMIRDKFRDLHMGIYL